MRKILFLIGIPFCFLLVITLSKGITYVHSIAITSGDNQCSKLYIEINPQESANLEICGKSYKVTHKGWVGETAKVEVAGKDYNINGVSTSVQPEEHEPPFWINIYPKDPPNGEIAISVEEYWTPCRIPDCSNKAEIEIQKGWNLIAPATWGLWDSTWSTCDKEELLNPLFIFFYDPFQAKYIKGSEIGESNLGESYLMSGSAWVYSQKKCKMVISHGEEDIYSNFLREVNEKGITFPTGWNFFSITPDMVGKTFDGVRGSCGITKIYIWNPFEQKWEKLKLLDEPTTIGYGFVFKTSNECQLGEAAPVLPPPLPG